jgi:hypothetical protein
VSSRVGQEYKRDYGHAYCQTALEGEKVAPICYGAAFDLESTEGEQTAESVGNVRGGVKDGQSTTQFTAAVKLGLIIYDQREEGTCCTPFG